jgi:hypothetical protein
LYVRNGEELVCLELSPPGRESAAE